MESVKKQQKIFRRYRNIRLRCILNCNLDEAETEKIVALFEKPSSSLEEFEYNEASHVSLVLRLLSICPYVKKLHLNSVRNISNDNLPVLQNLEELVIPTMSRCDIIHIAPNLRKLETRGELYDLPLAIQKLPLEQLKVNCTFVRDLDPDLFQKCSKVTKLKAIALFGECISPKSFEHMCRICPLLTKLRISIPSKTKLQCLTSLSHLKHISLLAVNYKLLANSDVCLPSVEIVELTVASDWRFSQSIHQTFRNVHYLKIFLAMTESEKEFMDEIGETSDSFPHLKTFELYYLSRRENYSFAVKLFEGLSDLRELIMNNIRLQGSYFPPMNIQQLTLKECELVVTDEMVNNLPNLQFLNLHSKLRLINAEKLPSSCTVRRYPRKNNDLFDRFRI
ncbi:uncharacterized protein LOC128742184 isoform X2 [Sabethes cyaneus]|nr:uncharacterized protein LOC128742184 isoform X2 [Sabethes cyaneus]